MAKFKVGDVVKTKVDILGFPSGSFGKLTYVNNVTCVHKISLGKKQYYCDKSEIEPAGPYWRYHQIAREICGESP